MSSDLFGDAAAARKAARAAYRLATKEKRRAYNAAYYAANPHKQAEYRERFRAARPDYYQRYWADPEYREKRRLAEAARRATPEVRAAMIVQRQSAEYKAGRAAYKLLAAYRKRLAEYEAGQLAIKPFLHKQKLTPEQMAIARNARVRARYQADALYNLQRRMSSAVRMSLRVGRSSKRWQSKWLDLVGYTTEQLRDHIERQFVPKMGWHNMAKWHIDHITPLSSFTFETADDPEFKQAWALTNLRPLWGPDNIRKHAKRELLV